MTGAPTEPPLAFAELGRIRFDDTDLEGVLLRVATLAKQTVPGAADVSVTLVRGQKAHTAAFTGHRALTLDETQYEQGFGPCLDVAQSSGTVLVADMVAETRWPQFTRHALEAGVHSSLSLALPVQEDVVGALNMYATKPHSFTDESVELARTFASYAAVAVANAHLYDSSSTLAQNMQQAMESRAVIEQAKGIIMGREGCDASHAFSLLTKVSQASNRKLRDVAAEVVASTATDRPA